MKKIFFIGVFILICLCGCSTDNSDVNDDGTVSYMEAKEMIINDGAILIDVRTQEEYDDEHIDGAILMPVNDIDEDTASNNITSKNSFVIVYCGSGKRSSEAASKLRNLGYTEVYDLGAISNWEE